MKKIKWFVLIIELLFLGLIWFNREYLQEFADSLVKTQNNEIVIKDVFETFETPVEEIKIVETKKKIDELIPTIIKIVPTATPTIDNEPWGVSRQIDEVTWTMKVGEDEKMATAKEIFDALNEYRKRYNSQQLTWDGKLGDYAQSRAKYLNSIKTVDKHEGFNNFVNNEDGFNKLGFTMLGENISFGYKLNGVHIIEWMYAGDKPHNDNQLDNRWNFVGIGVEGLGTCLIFGTGKM